MSIHVCLRYMFVVVVEVSLIENNTEIGFAGLEYQRLIQNLETRGRSMVECQIVRTRPRSLHFGDVRDMIGWHYMNVQPQMAIEEGCTSLWMYMEEMTVVAYVPPGENSQSGSP